MYFWKVDKLNDDLIRGKLDESEIFKYLMANTLFIAPIIIKYGTFSTLDTIASVLSYGLIILGLWFFTDAMAEAMGRVSCSDI